MRMIDAHRGTDTALVFALVNELRRLGIAVSTGEAGDALISLTSARSDLTTLRHALGACLVKTAAHREIHDTVFDILTADRADDDDRELPPQQLDDVDDETLHAALTRAMATGNLHLQRVLARIYITRHAGFAPDRPSAGTLYVSRVLRAARTEAIRERLLDAADAANRHPAGLRTAQGRADQAMDGFERIVATEVRRLLVQDRGALAVTRTVMSAIPDDVDFLTAGFREREALLPLVESMARSIHSPVDRAGRRRGHVDVRATIRASVNTGGVPLKLEYRKRPAPPRTLIVLADVSGSVAPFAHFSLTLTATLHQRFSRTRAFVFVDGLDEITSTLAVSSSLDDLATRLRDERRGLTHDGRTDYGQAFAQLLKHADASLDSRAVVLILGDARNNYFDPNTQALAAIKARVSRVWWLNPEREVSWGDGDSAALDYAQQCDAMIECRTARQLRGFMPMMN